MTFKNPSEDFRMKLIKGGGVSLDVLIKFNIKLTIHDLLRWEL
jgi:hypothetical protein